MNDIQSRNDIIQFVDAFYQKALTDDLIQHFFTEVVQINWNHHLPVIYDFWDSILLGTSKYKANAMIKHISLHRQSPLKPAHFDRWLALWEETIQTRFSGPKAIEAVTRAKQIGALMQHKIENQDNIGF